MAGKKKNPSAKYAFIALIVALVACIATGLIGTAKGMVALQMFTLEPGLAGNLTLALQISAGLLVIGLAAYAMMTPDSVRRFFTGRQARYGSNTLILTLAFLGIIFGVNYIVYQNPGLLGSPWDLTEDKSNTLAPETMQIIATLPEKVNAIAFFSTNLDTTNAQDLLQKFKASSNGKFDYQFINPDTNPVAAREAGITGDGKILLQMGDTKEIASNASETELSRTMIRLISPEDRVVYFLQGHGEPSIDSNGGDVGYSIAKSTLESKNYTVNTLNLFSTGEVPQDAQVVIIAGPQKPLSAKEVSLLKDYVNAGGSLVVMEDPPFFTNFGSNTDPLAGYLASDWGITLNDDVIIDTSGVTNNAINAVSVDGTEHPITQNLSNKYIVILPQSRSITTTLSSEPAITVTPLLFTTSDSWGETELTADETPTNDPQKDTQGPLTLAASGENSDTKGRVVVIGNSIFASDNGFDAYGNGNLFINSVDWAAEQESLLTLTTRESTPRYFTPPAQFNFLILVLITVIVIPGMFIFMGISSWVARRKRG